MKTNKLGQDEIKAPEGPHVIHMQLDARAVEYVIYSLKNLYADPLFAAFREYVANAIDANERAGSARPVEIEVTHEARPNLLEPATWVAPMLRIRDYGAGMDEADLANYASYGFSDKRDSNAERGGYGYGGKSALAFTNRFTIISIKAGTRYEVAVHAEFRQAGFFEITSIEPTNEPSGVLIEIPLSPEQGLRLLDRASIIDQLRGYPTDAVAFNGKAIQESIHDEENYLPVTEPAGILGWVGLHTPRNHSGGVANWSRTHLVIGGIVYDLPTPPNLEPGDMAALRYLQALRTGFVERIAATNDTYYINFPIGSLELIPSRDSIQYNEANIAVIREGIEKFFTSLPHAAFQRLQQVETPTAALNFAYDNWGLFTTPTQRSLAALSTSWRGKQITAAVQQAEGSKWIVVTSHVGRGVHRYEIDGSNFQLPNLIRESAKPKYESDRASIILRVPEVTEAVVLEVEKKAREYGQFALGTGFLSTYITDAPTLEFWTAETVPQIRWDAFIAAVKAGRAAKREQITPIKNQRVLRYPVTVPGQAANFEWVAANELPQQAVYMPADWFPEGDSFSSPFWYYAKTPLPHGTYHDAFAKALAAVVGATRPIIVVPPGRSVTNFQKYVPKAELFTTLFVTRLSDIINRQDTDSATYEEMVRVFQQADGRHDRAYIDFRFLAAVLHHEQSDIRLRNDLYRAVIANHEADTALYRLAQLTVNMQHVLRANVSYGGAAELAALLEPHVPGQQKVGMAGDLDIFIRNQTLRATDAHRIIRSLNAYAPGAELNR